jgi:Icc protein
MKTLRVAQITDIHLLPEPGAKLFGVDTAIALQRVINAIVELSPQPELIIATGDLAEDSSDKTYSRLRNILTGADIPVYVLPGNHDDSNAMRDVLVDSNISFVGMASRDNWNFVFVNSQAIGESYGYISADEMSSLKTNLAAVGDAPVVVALHHTPMPICPRANCQLQNVNELNQLLGEFPNVKAVIAGHTHIEAEEINGSHIRYTTPSTFAQVDHGQATDSEACDFWSSHTMDGLAHGFRVLDLMPDGTVNSRVHWVYDA